MGKDQSKEDEGAQCRDSMRKQLEEVRKLRSKNKSQASISVPESNKVKASGWSGQATEHRQLTDSARQTKLDSIHEGASLREESLILVSETHIEPNDPLKFSLEGNMEKVRGPGGQLITQKYTEPYADEEKTGNKGKRVKGQDSSEVFHVVDNVTRDDLKARNLLPDASKNKSARVRKGSIESMEGDDNLQKCYTSDHSAGELSGDDDSGENGSEDYDDAVDYSHVDPMQTLMQTKESRTSLVTKKSRMDSLQSDFGSVVDGLPIIDDKGRNSEVHPDRKRMSNPKLLRRNPKINSSETCQVGCSFNPFSSNKQDDDYKSQSKKEQQKKKKIDKDRKLQLLQKNNEIKAKMTNKKDQLQKLALQNEKKRTDEFENERLQRVKYRQLTKIKRLNIPQEEVDAIKQNEEVCCELCYLPSPLLCWRYKMLFQLDKGKLSSVNGQNSRQAPAQRQQKDKAPEKDLSKFEAVDGWRDKLMIFIQQESGTYQATDKMWLRNFYDYEKYHTQILNGEDSKGLVDSNMNTNTTFDSSHAGPNKNKKTIIEQDMVRQSAQFQSAIAKSKKQMTIETGQSVLMVDEKVHDFVLFINKQLEMAGHPIKAAMNKFKTLFHQHNMVLLCRQTEFEMDEPLVGEPMEDKLHYAELTVNAIIDMFVNAILIFYEMDTQIKSFDRQRDLFVNLVTNLIIEGEVYFLLFNLCSSWLEPQQRILRKSMFSQETLENDLPITSLTQLPQFQFDVNFRNQYEKEVDPKADAYTQRNDSSENEKMMRVSTANTTNLASSGGHTSQIKIVGMPDPNTRSYASSDGKKKRDHKHGKSKDDQYVYAGNPYSYAIKDLQKLSCLQSPMSKLEWIYNCCTRQVSKEIDLFWKGYDIPTKKLFVDPDNLQGIIIFIVSRLKNPQIITEVHFIRKFVPMGVKRLGRFYHCEMVGAACSYLLQIEQEKIDKQNATKKVNSKDKLDDAYTTSKDKARPNYSNSSSEREDEDTMRDDVSWEALAFGQSMRGSFNSILKSPQVGVGPNSSVVDRKSRLQRLRDQNQSMIQKNERQTFIGISKDLVQSQDKIASNSKKEQEGTTTKNGKSPTNSNASPTFPLPLDSKDEVEVVWVEGEGEENELRVIPKAENEGVTDDQDDLFRELEKRQYTDVAAEGQDQPVVELVDTTFEAHGIQDETNGEESKNQLAQSKKFGQMDSKNGQNRSGNALLDRINRLRQNNHRDAESSQSVYFKRNKFKSLMQNQKKKHQSVRPGANDPYAPSEMSKRMKQANLEKDEESDQEDESFDLSPTRALSMVEFDDNFYFSNNPVLKGDIQQRLGEKISIEMAQASKRGYNQARCISEL